MNGYNLITTQQPQVDGTITSPGQVIVVGAKTCYGDFDNDGDIDDDDEAILDAAMNTDPTDNVLCDYDLDCQVGLLSIVRRLPQAPDAPQMRELADLLLQ